MGYKHIVPLLFFPKETENQFFFLSMVVNLGAIFHSEESLGYFYITVLDFSAVWKAFVQHKGCNILLSNHGSYNCNYQHFNGKHHLLQRLSETLHEIQSKSAF